MSRRSRMMAQPPKEKTHLLYKYIWSDGSVSVSRGFSVYDLTLMKRSHGELLRKEFLCKG